MAYRTIVVLSVSLAISACTSFLPRGATNNGGGFASFEAARAAADRIVPLQTRLDELGPLGFDFAAGQNVTLVSYPEIVVRLTPHPGVPISQLDPGIQRCIDIQTACKGYTFRFEREDRVREGNFWLDFLNAVRTTRVTGWRFEALIVVGADTVLFRNYSGQARIERVDRQVNPLGPLQPAGERLGVQ